jgi:hypothetical protein
MSQTLKEWPRVRQIPGESKRRWFSSEEFDLIVWYSEDRHITGFELCYDKTGQQRSIAWRSREGYCHMAVDDGEHGPDRHKATPILVADGAFDATSVHSSFLEASHALPEEIAVFVLQALERHPEFGR